MLLSLSGRLHHSLSQTSIHCFTGHIAPSSPRVTWPFRSGPNKDWLESLYLISKTPKQFSSPAFLRGETHAWCYLSGVGLQSPRPLGPRSTNSPCEGQRAEQWVSCGVTQLQTSWLNEVSLREDLTVAGGWHWSLSKMVCSFFITWNVSKDLCFYFRCTNSTIIATTSKPVPHICATDEPNYYVTR